MRRNGLFSLLFFFLFFQGHLLASDLVVSLKTDQKIRTISDLPTEYQKASKLLLSYQRQGEKEFTTLIEMPRESFQIDGLTSDPNLKWAQEPTQFIGDPREFSPPTDPEIKDQTHHDIIQTFEGWKSMSSPSGEQVIIAVTDDGIDFNHPDLKNQIWLNTQEIPGDGIDNDDNGMIDDVNGWNFTENNGDISPYATHGTHVSGIIAAEANNDHAGTGLAPMLKIMPLTIFGGSRRYSSQLILEAYTYAADNGAKIITTSYNIDQFANDPIYLTAVDYAYQQGLIIFNSGGNNNYQGARRESIEQVLLVASTETGRWSRDEKSSFSNYGVGLDIAAPGTDIYSTLTKGRFGKMSGTSMAAPMAAALAGLIWLENPSYTRNQVVETLISSTDSIENKNNRYRGLLGSGRINVQKALKNVLSAPTLTPGKQSEKGMEFIVSGVIDPESLNNPQAFQIFQGDLLIATRVAEKKYFMGTNTIQVSLKDLPQGSYRVVPNQEVLKSPLGTPITL